MSYNRDSHFEQRADMHSRELEWDYDCEATLEDVIDWRSELERVGDNKVIAELNRALEDYHAADTETDACNSEID